MAKNPNLSKLNELGQSVWYDNLSRDVLKSGELKGLIDSGVSGLTSNPTIFKKAIADTADYDAEIRSILKKGEVSTESLCEDLMVADVGSAADLLKPIFGASKGTDGHASIEVSPFLANDTKSTLEAARRLWSRLDRPNIMIKIPATPEGLPAIREALSSGINVNITLIFSVAVYSQVIEAFLSGLEDRVARKEPISGIASVASFFVSRVDSICESFIDSSIKEGKLTESDRNQYLGKVGVANSKLAYRLFKEVVESERFRKLKAAGAQFQRPLWASTGTKNPAFSPVMYVEALTGAHTVNTMPPQTVKALMEKATIAPNLEKEIPAAALLIDELKGKGVPFDKLLLDLQHQGVKLFADSYRELLASLETKRKAIANG